MTLQHGHDDQVREDARHLEESPQDPGVLDALGVVLARRGEFQQAIEVASRAETCARAQGNPQLADAIRKRSASYRTGQPFLE